MRYYVAMLLDAIERKARKEMRRCAIEGHRARTIEREQYDFTWAILFRDFANLCRRGAQIARIKPPTKPGSITEFLERRNHEKNSNHHH